MSKSSVSMKVWVLLERYFKQNYALKTKKFSSSTLTTVLKCSTQCDWSMYNLYFKPYLMSQFFIFHNQCPHTYIFQNSLLIFFPRRWAFGWWTCIFLVQTFTLLLQKMDLYFSWRWNEINENEERKKKKAGRKDSPWV